MSKTTTATLTDLAVDQRQDVLSPEVTVIVPVSERHDDLVNLFDLYAAELAGIGKPFEFLFGENLSKIVIAVQGLEPRTRGL